MQYLVFNNTHIFANKLVAKTNLNQTLTLKFQFLVLSRKYFIIYTKVIQNKLENRIIQNCLFINILSNPNLISNSYKKCIEIQVQIIYYTKRSGNISQQGKMTNNIMVTNKEQQIHYLKNIHIKIVQRSNKQINKVKQ